jgi:hypothetical protein
VGPVVAKDCAKYCSDIETACKDDATENNQQYIDKTTCLTMCSAMDTGSAADNKVDTFKCRLGYLGSLGEAQGPVARRAVCYNAGPYSKVCGDTNGECGAFCKLNVRLCQGTLSAFQGQEAQCVTDCTAGRAKKNGLEDTAKESMIKSTTGDSLICRGYHLNAAAQNDAARNTHCLHTTFGTLGTPCK